MTDAPDRLAIRSDLAELGRLFAFIDRFCVEAGVRDGTRMRLTLLAEELAVNAMTHGYGGRPDGRIEIALWREGGSTVELQIEDEAPAFDPLTEAPAPAIDADLVDRPIGGLGIHLVRSMAQAMDYRFQGGRNVVRATVGEAPSDT